METHRPTEKVLDILELLASTDDELSFSEIANKLSIPRGSLFPVVHTLCNRKYIRLNPISQKYTLGMKCYEIGSRYLSHLDVGDEIRNIMKRMAYGCGETCHFAVLDGTYVLYLYKEESPEPIRMISSIGKRIPAHSTAIGKALLSQYSDDELREMYRGGLESLTENTITDPEVLIKQIRNVRAEKIAYETEESSRNITCIAVPVEKDGRVVAAISASILIFRASDEKIANVKRVLEEGRQNIENLLKTGGFII